MLGIGMQELMIILLVALVVIGPKKLPDVAKQIAKGVRELRRASDDLKHSIMVDIDDPPYRPPARHPPARALPPSSKEDRPTTDGAPDGEPSTDSADPSISTVGGHAVAGDELHHPPGITGSAALSQAESEGGDHDRPEGTVSREEADRYDAPDGDGDAAPPEDARREEIDNLVAKAKARQQAAASGDDEAAEPA